MILKNILVPIYEEDMESSNSTLGEALKDDLV